jgi:hypothetical protein
LLHWAGLAEAEPARRHWHTTQAFSPLPSIPEWLNALQREIEEILPKRPDTMVSTPGFVEFQAHLRSLKPPEQPQPTLIRHAPQFVD